MFEDLRNEGSSSPLCQQGEELDPLLDAPAKKKRSGGGFPKMKFGRKFLGLTAFQRFVVSFLLMIAVSVVGLALSVVTNTIAIPGI